LWPMTKRVRERRCRVRSMNMRWHSGSTRRGVGSNVLSGWQDPVHHTTLLVEFRHLYCVRKRVQSALRISINVDAYSAETGQTSWVSVPPTLSRSYSLTINALDSLRHLIYIHLFSDFEFRRAETTFVILASRRRTVHGI